MAVVFFFIYFAPTANPGWCCFDCCSRLYWKCWPKLKIQSQKHFSPCICTSNSTTADRSVDQLILPRATPSSRRPLADLDVTSATTTLTKIKKMDTYNHTQARTPVQNDTVKRKRFKFNKFSKILVFFFKNRNVFHTFTLLVYLLIVLAFFCFCFVLVFLKLYN